MSPLRPTDKGYFLEFNEYFLLVARTRSLSPPLVIEDLREAPLDNKNAVTQMLGAVIPAVSRSTARAICSMRPKGRFFHLAGEDEARQFATAAAVETFVKNSALGANGANGIVTVQADSGLLLNGSSNARWLLIGAPHDGLAAAKTMMDEWKIDLMRSEAAALSLLSALTTSPAREPAPTPLFVWDIGENSSDLLLIGAGGLESATNVAFGFDKIAEALQAEISLKFKGAAIKLFFNEYYDFSEVGVRIASRVGDALRPALAGISHVGPATKAALLCTGLSSKQAWFTQCLAKSLDLVPWQPDLANWCRQAGLQFVGNTLQGNLSPSWIGLLEVIRAFNAEAPEANNPWHPVWNNLPEVKSPPAKTAADAPAPTAPAASPAPQPVAVATTKAPEPVPATIDALAVAVAVPRSVAKLVPPPPPQIPASPKSMVKPRPAATSAPAPKPPQSSPTVKAAASVAAHVNQPTAVAAAPAPTPAPVPAASRKSADTAKDTPPVAAMNKTISSAPPKPDKSDTILREVPRPRAPVSQAPERTSAQTMEKKPIAPKKTQSTHVVAIATPKPAPVVPVSVVSVPSAQPSVAPAPVAKAAVAPVPAAKTPVAPTPAVNTPAAQAAAVRTPVAPAPVAKAPVAPVPVVRTPVVPTPAVNTPAAQAAAIRTPVAPAPVAKAPVAPVPVAKTPIAPIPSVTAPTARASAVRYPSGSAPVAKAPVAPAPPAPAKVAPAQPVRLPIAQTITKTSLALEPSGGDDRPARKTPFIKTPVGMAVIAVAVILLGAGVFFYNQLQTEKAAALHAQQLAEQRAAAALEARHKAELQAKAEADARQRAVEEAAAQRKAEAEAARQKAVEEARLREVEANRLLNARGSLAISTEPAGATITINNLVPRTSPATINDLRLGRYAVQVSLEGYEAVNLDLEVKENETTNPGPIHLVRQCGSLEVTTEPAGADFQVRSAAPRLIAIDADVKRGKTPAVLTDLPTGSYVVSFSRPGWPEHTVNAAVEYKKTAAAVWKYSGGIVEITSDPAGAQVSLSGSVLGVTPLTLKEIPPGLVSYALELRGFIPATVSGKVEAEQTLRLASSLMAEDRIARITDLDERPVAIKTVEPTLSYKMNITGGNATISLVVGRDGVPTDLKVESASDRDVGACCLAAAAKWRFKPGLIKGHPVKVRVSLPFNFGGS